MLAVRWAAPPLLSSTAPNLCDGNSSTMNKLCWNSLQFDEVFDGQPLGTCVGKEQSFMGWLFECSKMTQTKYTGKNSRIPRRLC